MDVDHVEIPESGAILAEYLFEDVDSSGHRTARNWNGSYARAQVRRTAERTSTLFGTLTSADLIELTTDGWMKIDFAEDFIANIPPGQYVVDIRTEDPVGKPDYPFRILLTIPDTTTGPEDSL